jgi:Ca2+/Na+ antiporter
VTKYQLNMHIRSPSWFDLSQKATANLAQSAFIPSLVFTVLAFLIVTFRWISRLCLAPRTWYREDLLVTSAMVCILLIFEYNQTDGYLAHVYRYDCCRRRR